MNLSTLKKRLSARVPMPAKHRARRALRALAPGEPVDWGDLRRLRPFTTWGIERGTPLERYYVDRFIAARADRVTGRVLEVGAAEYATRFGRRVRSVDVLDVDPANRIATRVGDLGTPGVLEADRWDCFLLLFTLQYPRDLTTALAQSWACLAPGGTLFLAVPGLTRMDPDNRANDRHRFTPVRLRELLAETCGDAEVEVETYGNLLVVVAYLLGLAAEDLRADELAVADPDFPLVHAAAITRRRDGRPGTPPGG